MKPLLILQIFTILITKYKILCPNKDSKYRTSVHCFGSEQLAGNIKQFKIFKYLQWTKWNIKINTPPRLKGYDNILYLLNNYKLVLIILIFCVAQTGKP